MCKILKKLIVVSLRTSKARYTLATMLNSTRSTMLNVQLCCRQEPEYLSHDPVTINGRRRYYFSIGVNNNSSSCCKQTPTTQSLMLVPRFYAATQRCSLIFMKFQHCFRRVTLLPIRSTLFTSDKEGGLYGFARTPELVCLSVCLCARLLKNSCMDVNEMLRVDRCRDMDELINF